jgi:hypothetical protein
MPLAIPIRESNKASQAKCLRFRRYTPPRLHDFLSHAESADTKSSRICTFRSYLKPRIFNARTARSAFFRLTHFVCADAKPGGEGLSAEAGSPQRPAAKAGRYPCSNTAVWNFLPRACTPIVPLGHRSTMSQQLSSFLSIVSALPVIPEIPTRAFSCVYALQGGGICALFARPSTASIQPPAWAPLFLRLLPIPLLVRMR